MDLLIFFAIPTAVIILSAISGKSIKSPNTIAAITFSILLIVTFAAFDVSFLVWTIIYTTLSYITAVMSKFWRYLGLNKQQDETKYIDENKYRDEISERNNIIDDNRIDNLITNNGIPLKTESNTQSNPIDENILVRTRRRRRR